MVYSFNVGIADGLHARPCAKLVDILSGFTPLQITGNGKTINTLSILELLLLKIPHGSEVKISSEIPLPNETIDKLTQLFGGE
ncbi:MAG: HPr family phosphocarrier protein [Proteobacteria bacterium]|nr:HPr family phosphocarrier protein [Pseudomonadota bacterium]